MRELTEKKTEIITSPCRMSTSRQTDTRLSLGSNQQPPTSSYFTLTELLVVIGIIAVLGGLLMAGAHSVQQRAKRDNTRVLIERVETALAQYRNDAGNLDAIFDSGGGPDVVDTSAEQLALTEMLQQRDAVEQREIQGGIIVDPWGGAIYIRRHGHNQPGLDIWSGGPNGTAGEIDDDSDGDVDEADGDDDPDHAITDETDDVVNWTRDMER